MPKKKKLTLQVETRFCGYQIDFEKEIIMSEGFSSFGYGWTSSTASGKIVFVCG